MPFPHQVAMHARACIHRKLQDTCGTLCARSSLGVFTTWSDTPERTMVLSTWTKCKNVTRRSADVQVGTRHLTCKKRRDIPPGLDGANLIGSERDSVKRSPAHIPRIRSISPFTVGRQTRLEVRQASYEAPEEGHTFRTTTSSDFEDSRLGISE